jgi:DNA-binding transcriptional LysR family regulator
MALEILDRPLRYFLCIAELGSLSRAAEKLDQSQSGLSKQLAQLEASLGQALFVRTGRGVTLTEAGEQLYASLLPAYRAIDAATEAARLHRANHGSVRLATVHTLSYYFTGDVVARFVSTRPHANLSLFGRSSPDVVSLVESGKVDLGFVYDVAVDTDSVTTWPLFDDRMALVARMDSHSGETVDLTAGELRLVGFPPHYALRRMLHSGGVKASFVAEAETIDAMLQLVASGVGACVLPARIPDELLADYGLRKLSISQPLLSRLIVAITPRDKPLSPLARQLLETAQQVAARR